MSDARLSREQVTELMKRLASDDAFRALFESKPASALVAMGVPAQTVVELSAACLCAAPLADKSLFQAATRKMDEASLMAYADMHVPQMSIKP